MSKLTVSELNPAGFQFFQDSETFLLDLNDDDLSITGGILSGMTRISVIQVPASEDIYRPSISFIY